MKPKSALRTFLVLAGSSLLAISSAHAQVYWDNDGGATAGFGTASGTWGTDAFWNTSATGEAGTFNTTNATTVPVNFGNGATGLGSGTINVGTVTSGNMTFASGSGAITLSGGTITMLVAATITVNNTTNTIGSVLSGSTTSLTKLGTGALILSGGNNYTGATNIELGTLQVNSGGTLGAITSALNMGTGSDGVLGNAVNLTLNTSAQVGAFTVKSNTSDTTTSTNINQLSIASGSTLTASTFTVGLVTTTNGTNTALSTGSTPGAGGTLTVTGATTIGLAAPATTGNNTTVVDLSGLHTFNSGALNVGSATQSKGTLYLASNANVINGDIKVGDGGNSNYNLAGVSQLYLGAGTNAFQAPILTIGRGKASGQILFAGSNGSVTITGANGSGTSAITIGNYVRNSYHGSAPSALLLAGHTATVSASTVIIGTVTTNNPQNGNPISQLTFDTGTFSASSITMVQIPTAAVNFLTGNTATGTFTVGGATANSTATGIVNVSGNILLGDHDSTAAGGVSGTLTINGGTVNANTGGSTTIGIYDGSANTTASKSSTLTLEGGTLNLNGGRIGGTGTPTGSVGIRNIDNLNFRSGILMNVASINNNQGVTKTTSGILNLDGTNSYTAGTSVTEGTLVFRNTAAKPSGGTHAFNAGTTLGLGVATSGSFFTTADVTNAFDGTMTGNLSNVTVTATTNVGIDTTAGDFTYSTSISGDPTKGLTKLGANKLTLSGTNTYTGATTVSVGTLYVTGALSNSAVTVQANGTVGSNGATGTLGQGLTILAGGNLDLTGATLGLTSTNILSITGDTLTLGNLTFQDIVGWDWANASAGTYELIDGSFSIDWGSTAYLSEGTAYAFGNGKSGYFASGSLTAVIVAIPEPDAAALIGSLGMLMLLRRRRN